MEFFEFLFVIGFFYIMIVVAKKSASTNTGFSEKTLKLYFSNVEKIGNTSANMTFYRGDKAGENFLLAIKYWNIPLSNLDISAMYDVAQKFHLHSKIIFTNENINMNPSLVKKLKEYDVQVMNSADFKNLINGSNTVSVLKTSDTSDDDCPIDESTNPIKYEKSGVRSILSFFRDKPERL